MRLSLIHIFGTQIGDAEKAMDECAPQLKCAGFVTTAGVLFPDMEDEMSFEDFFSLLGVDEYEYFGDDENTTTAEGWLRFQYRGMEVLINTNEAAAGGGWDFTGTELVKRDAPASIADPELSAANQEMCIRDRGGAGADGVVIILHAAQLPHQQMCIRDRL